MWFGNVVLGDRKSIKIVWNCARAMTGEELVGVADLPGDPFWPQLRSAPQCRQPSPDSHAPIPLPLISFFPSLLWEVYPCGQIGPDLIVDSVFVGQVSPAQACCRCHGLVITTTPDEPPVNRR